MDALSKLNHARDILLPKLINNLVCIELSEEHFTLKFLFKNGEQLYIRYNDYNEYSYQIEFSSQIGDFIRYDNFDDRWDVDTRPHHLHNRNKEVITSNMLGIPNHDMSILFGRISKLFNFNK